MKCEHCGSEMIVTKWNSAGNMAFCDNTACPRWHQPCHAGRAELTPAKILPRREPNPNSHKYRRLTRKDHLEKGHEIGNATK
jgi:ssDNA-binding Zn-finger/Zn-ribbon topoisomerase 1